MLYIAMSKRLLESLRVYPEPAIAICINYPGEAEHRVFPQNNLQAVLHLAFWDCDAKGNPLDTTDPTAPRYENHIFDEDMASKILAFVNLHKDSITSIYSACYAGISRSRGILAALSIILDGQEDTLLYYGGHPNIHVKSTILRVARKQLVSGDQYE